MPRTSKHILTVLEAVIRRHGTRTAVVSDGTRALTYRDLYRQGRAIANGLRTAGIRRGDVVALVMTVSEEYLVSLLGVWIAGAAFLPLPPDAPLERAEYILSDAQPKVVLTHDASPPFLNSYCGPILSFNQLLKQQKTIRLHNEPRQLTDLAYLFYTSGSTGRPNGVLVTHAGLVNILSQQIRCFDLRATSRTLLLLSMQFDASVSDIGTTWLAGATLCIESAPATEIASHIFETLRERRITHVDLPPSLLAAYDPKHLPPELRTIVIGGESCAIETVRAWAKHVKLVNVYGPTEATICTSMMVCNPRTWNGSNIGFPIKGIQYHVVDPDLQPVPPGSSGELLIRGDGLALGYVGQPQLTQERFVLIDGERWYRTRDVVRETPEGFFFVGRLDRIVKVRGQLVALEEVEARIANDPRVRRVAVVADKNDAQKTTLHAWIELNTRKDTTRDIVVALRKTLSPWMIPSRVTAVPQLPLLTNGKVNMRALQAPTTVPIKTAASNTPSTSLVERMRLIWVDVLRKPHLTIHDDFFEQGGDSLAVIEIVVRAKQQQIVLPIGSIIEERTVARLMRWYEQHAQSDASDRRCLHDFVDDERLTDRWKQRIRAATTLPRATTGAYFLTGGTGFLGIHLLHELLARQEDAIWVLVRAPSPQEGLKRLQATAASYNIPLPDSACARLRVFCGDIAQPRLGLSLFDWKTVCAGAHSVLHAAALVNMVLPYESLQKSNVQGVREAARCAMTHTKKQFIYCSTLSVFVATDKNTGTVYEDDDLQDIVYAYGGYAQSKIIAERWLRRIPSTALAMTCLRFGLLTGSTITGAHASHDYLHLFVQGLSQLGCVPRGNHTRLHVDSTPVDYAAAATVLIAQHKQAGTFHVANKKGFSLAQILRGLQRKHIHIKTISPEQWRERLASMDQSLPSAAGVLALCRLLPDEHDFSRMRSMDLFQATDITFDQRHTKQALQGPRLHVPPPSDALLDLYLTSFAEQSRS